MKIHVFLLMCMLTVQCTAASDRVNIDETTPGFSAVPGDYNATAVTVPLGPYNISFSTRLVDPTFQGNYKKSVYDMPVGKGKDYHMCDCDFGEITVSGHRYNYVNGTFHRDGWMHFKIYRYASPFDYPPPKLEILSPGRTFDGVYHKHCSWDDFDPAEAFLPVDVIINGNIGTIICSGSEEHSEYVRDKEHVTCMYGYSPEPTTFVLVLFSDMDWYKDISLVLETLNVTS
jgi:hypothetical protein